MHRSSSAEDDNDNVRNVWLGKAIADLRGEFCFDALPDILA